MSSAILTEREAGGARAGDARRATRPGTPPPAAGQTAIHPGYFFAIATATIAATAIVLLRGRPLPEIAFAVLTVAAAGVAAFALYRTLLPFAAPAEDEMPTLVGGRTRAALERDKVLTLRAIKELEFDRAMGKVAEGDFAEMRARLRARAVRLMQQLDEETPYREAIERDVEARLAAMPVTPAAHDTTPTCPECGTVNETDARFCKMCGHALRT